MIPLPGRRKICDTNFPLFHSNFMRLGSAIIFNGDCMLARFEIAYSSKVYLPGKSYPTAQVRLLRCNPLSDQRAIAVKMIREVIIFFIKSIYCSCFFPDCNSFANCSDPAILLTALNDPRIVPKTPGATTFCPAR